MMQITKQMIDQIRLVIPLQEGQESAEIPGVGGYFVTAPETPIPENARKVIEVGIDEVRYLIYGLVDFPKSN